MLRLKGCLAMICLFIWPAVLAAAEIDISRQLDEYLLTCNRINMQDKESAIEAFVNLDIKLRAFTKIISKQVDNVRPYWKKDYEILGLNINHYSDALDYGSSLLETAHKINPNSKFRKYTLFSEIHSDAYCWIEKQRNLEFAFQYLKEFPQGPFVSDVYMALGGYYASFYYCIKYNNEELKNNSRFKSDDDSCRNVFQQYIQDTAVISIDLQEKQAKDNAIKYYEAFLRAEQKQNEKIQDTIIELRAGGRKDGMRYGVYSCPD